MRSLIKRFLIHLDSERSASQFNLQAYGHDLEKFQEFLAPKLRQGYLPGDVTRDHIREYMAWLGETGHSRPNKPASRGRKLAAIKSFFKYCHRERVTQRQLQASLHKFVELPAELRPIAALQALLKMSFQTLKKVA